MSLLEQNTETLLLGLQPEAQLLLACARTVRDAESAKRIETLPSEDLDWKFLTRKADEHFITPLLYRNLNAVCPEAVPAGVLSGLRAGFQANARNNLFLTGELLRLLTVLNENSIPAIPYKGPLLAASAYGNIALRSFTDLDILVNERNVLKAKELLISCGYQPRTQRNREQEAARIRCRNEKDIVMMREDGAVSVELHWGIASLFLFPLNPQELWARAEEVQLGGATVLSLRPEDLLLVLCVHGAKHSFRRIQWISDIAELIRANQHIDWEQVTTLASTLRSRRMLSLGLFLASNLLGAVIPPEVERQVRSDPQVPLLADRVLGSLFRDTSALANVFAPIVFRGKLKEDRMDRTRLRVYSYFHKLRLAMKPNAQDKELLKLPGSLSFLYYILRPIRLLGVYGVGLLLHFLGQGRRP